MTYNLTPNQKELLRKLVSLIQSREVDEKFQILWDGNDACGFEAMLYSSQKRGKRLPTATPSAIEALVKNELLDRQEGSPSLSCQHPPSQPRYTITGKAYEAVDSDFAVMDTPPGPYYDLKGAQIGNFADTVQGNQNGGTIYNYGSNAADITRLITTLRDKAQAFPEEQKDDALDTLDDLERDLAQLAPDPGRISRRVKNLKKVAKIATALTLGTAAFSADLAQLAQALNVPLPAIPVEPIQPE